jgi:hypothetical protein
MSILIIGLYILFWCSLRTLPFLDFPNHLTRCYVISKLLSDPISHFHQFFSFNFSFTPYILGDLLLSSLILCTSLDFAAVLWPVVCFLSLPAALTFYLRQLGFERGQITLAQLFSLYLSSNWFFLSGFFNYQLSVSLVFIALGFWERVMANSSPLHSEAERGGLLYINYGLFILAVTSVYLMHLAGFFFLCLILAVNAGFYMWKRERFVRGVLLSLIPSIVIGGIHVLRAIVFSPGFGSGRNTMTFRSPLSKLTAIGTMFVRFDYTVDIILFIAFVILVAGAVLIKRNGYFPLKKETRTGQHLLFVIALIFVYAALPVSASGFGVSDVADVDNRALPFIFIFSLFVGLGAGTTLVDDKKAQESFCPNSKGSCLLKGYLISTVLLTLANLSYLVVYLTPYESKLKEYKQAILTIPENKVVLPIATWKAEGRIEVDLHFGALYTALRGGITPYLFSGDKNFPPTYFCYRQQWYAPSIFWYKRKQGIVDWSRVQSTYDYIITTKPLDMGQIDLPTMVETFSNNSTSVYALQKP